jgi:hypothetical protein
MLEQGGPAAEALTRRPCQNREHPFATPPKRFRLAPIMQAPLARPRLSGFMA